MVAARFRGSAPILRLLLDRGAEVDAPKGKPALFGASALYWSVFAGDRDSAQLLLDRGARLSGRVSLGGLLPPWTPIQIATMMDDPAMVSLLAERGASVNDGDSFSVTPLSRAVLRNSVDVARVLISKGAKINQVDQLGMTPLLYAATRDFGDTKMAELLLVSGADPKSKTKDGKTAVDLARLSGHLQVSQLLKK